MGAPQLPGLIKQHRLAVLATFGGALPLAWAHSRQSSCCSQAVLFLFPLWEPRVEGKPQLCCLVTESRETGEQRISVSEDRAMETVRYSTFTLQMGKLRSQRAKDFPKGESGLLEPASPGPGVRGLSFASYDGCSQEGTGGSAPKSSPPAASAFV